MRRRRFQEEVKEGSARLKPGVPSANLHEAAGARVGTLIGPHRAPWGPIGTCTKYATNMQQICNNALNMQQCSKDTTMLQICNNAPICHKAPKELDGPWGALGGAWGALGP